MPRPPTYDDQDVLDQAMDVFWRQGYHATSVRDLVKATGLQPGSLYAAFGGKRQLFQRVLDHYHELNVHQIRKYLGADTSPFERIQMVFDRLLSRCEEDLEGRGCLMVNTILELSCIDTELSQRANNMFDEIERRLAAVVEEGQERGQIARDKPAPVLARYLVMSIHGIRVYSRGNLDPSHLRSLVDETLETVTRHT